MAGLTLSYQPAGMILGLILTFGAHGIVSAIPAAPQEDQNQEIGKSKGSNQPCLNGWIDIFLSARRDDLGFDFDLWRPRDRIVNPGSSTKG